MTEDRGVDGGQGGAGRDVVIPAMGLVVLVGVSGSGKSTFAARHFRGTEVVSSDACRALVADDENDQAATPDAFALLHVIVGTRLRRGLLTVVDATNTQARARAELVALARSHDVLADAIVLDVPEAVAVRRNAGRADRDFGAGVVARQHRDLHRSLGRLRKEGFRRVHVLRGADEIDAARVLREPSWNDRRELPGPFDVIGDVHGCLGELIALLDQLGWRIERDAGGTALGAAHPQGRTAVFVGDLVDRGPDVVGVLRLVMGMAAAGTALVVAGNHEVKLVRALKGADVTVSHGLGESLTQLGGADAGFRAEALAFMDRLISHYVLDEGRLVVAHAGLPEAYHGRASRRVRSFALYGDTTGETDAYGLPVRYPWARDYRGSAVVAYGHTPTPRAEWINGTICLDTGAVFGGALSALRYPEREIVAVPAQREWYAPTRPLAAAPGSAEPGSAEPGPGAPGPAEPGAGRDTGRDAGRDAGREPASLRFDDVAGTRWLTSAHAGKVKIEEENAAAALEIMSRFAVDPRWLIYLPPTMSPAAAAREGEFLEHPEQAFTEYAEWGQTRVVCEEKHMGSRAIVVLASDDAAAARRFGVADGSRGAVYTRTGRPFFADVRLHQELVTRLLDATRGLFAALETDWLALDCELLPWSAKAGELIRGQYASVGAAATSVLPAAEELLRRGQSRGLDVDGRLEAVGRRLANARAYRQAYAAYCRPTDGLGGITLAPFQILAAQGRLLALEEPHEWHLAQLATLDDPLLTPTRSRVVDLASTADREAATQWWLDRTAAGGEGMVVKPAAPVAAGGERGERGGRRGRMQPGLKVRGREYLRLVYGPDYSEALELLRDRHLGRKRQLAIREHGLGLDALAGFVGGAPLWQVHQAVFAVLALESEPVDPRL